MRKFLVPLLLASALVPAAALAQDGDRHGGRAQAERSSHRDSRSEARSEARSERADRPQRAERAQRAERSDSRQVVVERAQRNEQSSAAERGSRPERIQRAERPADRVPQDIQPVQQVEAPQPPQSTTTTSGSRDSGSLVDAFRRVARGDTHDDHDGDWKGDKDHHGDWKRDWRKDRRYDWHRYRSHYGSLYRLGHYYDPYGWGYNRWSIGYRLWPSYYGSSFWLNDPWRYRLPPAYGPYRWVRYYDDALLVNIYTGQVVDVIHNFFW